MLVYGFMVEPLVLLYLGFGWFWFLVANRIRTFKNEGRRFFVHSRYAGTPYLAMLIARDENRGKNLEAISLFMLAVTIGGVRPYLGLFFFLGFVGMAFVMAIEQTIERRRVMHLRDAEIMQRNLMDRYRNGF